MSREAGARGAILLPVVAMLLVGRASMAQPAQQRAAPLEALLAEADAIVAAEILATDYTRTASDGPMYGDALVLKVVKGDLGGARRVRFGASAWIGPTYQPGESRILFLKQVSPQHAYFAGARWSSVEAGRLDLFLAPEALGRCSQEGLREFLGRIRAPGGPPEIRATVTRRHAVPRILSVALVNSGTEVLWLDPSRLVTSADAAGVRHSLDMRWDGSGAGTWKPIPPGGSLTGTASLRTELASGEMTLSLSHHAARFPDGGWVGSLAVTPSAGR